MSLPKQTEDWADLKAAYRLLNNEHVTPERMLAVHRQRTLEMCEPRSVVLCVQDTSHLDFTNRRATKGLGHIGTLGGRGIIMHSALAVTTSGQLLGVLDQRFHVRDELHTDESITQLRSRWRESDFWSESVERVGHPAPSCRFIVVADRAGDCFSTLQTSLRMDAGFVIRAGRDRRVEAHSDTLWSWAEQQTPCGTRTVAVGRQAKPWGKVTKITRDAEVSIRFGQVTLDPPYRSKHEPITVWVVYAKEEHPPEGETVEAIDWMLLCSEKVEDLQTAEQMLDWYSKRWVIEEWHRVLKDGCNLESSQLHQADAIECLATLLGVVAVRLLQLRDLAGLGLDPAGSEADDPAALVRSVPRIWIHVLAVHQRLDAKAMTPRQFWIAIARRGGYIGRKRDGRPGWKAIWQGWYDYIQMVEYAEALNQPPTCG